MDELTKALIDYYDARTDHVRKQNLHEQLNKFLVDRDSWRIALKTLEQQQHDLTNVMSPILIYFLLQVLEHSIHHHYSDPQQIRPILFWFYFHLFDSMPTYVRSKLCLLIVRIARCDSQWSTDEYFQTCYHLIETQSYLGLVLLTTTIEDFGQFNEDCTIKRCQYLKSTLNQHIPHLIQIIHLLLKKEDQQLKDPLLIKQQALVCLDRLINRLPILPLTIELIDDLFRYSSSTWSIDALDCIHEIILKQHIPRQYDTIFHATLHRIIQLISIINENSAKNIRNKITEIIRSLFNLHLNRCESNQDFPMFDLLTNVYKFTFQQTTQDGFYACLEIWSTFIEYIKANDEIRSTMKEHSFEKYFQVLRPLSQELLQRIHNGQNMAENLEETNDLDDSETTIERYIRECIDLISKLSDIPILSGNILHSLITHLQTDIEKYKSLSNFIEISPNNQSRRHLSLNDESINAYRQLLHGLDNLLNTFSRIANACLFDNDCSNQKQAHFQNRIALVQQFVQLIVYIVHIRLDSVDCPSKPLYHQFISVQTRSFECVVNLTQWLGHMVLVHNSDQESYRIIQELIIHTIDTCAPLIDVINCDNLIAMSSGTLLHSMICRTRHSVPLDQVNSIKHLVHRILTWNVTCDTKANFQLYKLAIKTVLLLILNEQQLSENFFRTIFQPLNIISEPSKFFNSQHDQQLIRCSFIEYTKLLTELIETVRTENNKIRQNLFLSIQYLISGLNGFLPLIVNRDTECETSLISVLLITFELLRTQMGTELMNIILQTTFSAFNIENIRNSLYETKPNSHMAVSRFLEFLLLLVNEPGNNKLTQQFLPTILELCTTVLYPAIRHNFGLDIREIYYKLVHNLLINNWRYFFKGNVLTTFNGETETTANEQYFIQLMESIAWSFSQSDIEQFRTNLLLCNELRIKCGLYTKAIFRQQMSQAFLSLLLNVLLARSHELCRDDIISTLFFILTTDNSNDFSHFIQSYLEQSHVQNVLNEKHKRLLLESYSKNETDLPSFTQNLNDFIHDYRHYITTNSIST